MTKTMIERVAAAIEAAGDKWANEHTFDFWDEAPLEVYARAAIEAMMVPNHDMTGAVLEPGEDRTELVAKYQAMITAALEE